MNKPVLVMREVTERPEGVVSGVAKLVGTEKKRIVEQTFELLEDKAKYAKMASRSNPYGDGEASRRIRKILEKAWRRA